MTLSESDCPALYEFLAFQRDVEHRALLHGSAKPFAAIHSPGTP